MLKENILLVDVLIQAVEISELMVFKDSVTLDVRLLNYYFLFLFNIDDNTPGPNTYKAKNLIGVPIFNSKYQSPCFYSCSQKIKIPNSKDRYPGPGSYISFSEFGILDPNYKKRLHLQTEPNKEKENEDNKNEENQGYDDFKENKEEEEKPKREETKKKTKKEETKQFENKNEETKNAEKTYEQTQKSSKKENKETKNEDKKSDTPLLRETLQY